MKRMNPLILLFLILLNISQSDLNIEEKNYFQLYPSLDPNAPNYFYVLTNQYLHKLNATEGDSCKIIDSSDINEYTYKDISSIITISDSYLVKTCVGPNKLVEIIQGDSVYSYPRDLSDIKFCYSSQILNPIITSEHKEKYLIFTYFISETSEGKYSHKAILFYPSSAKFSDVEYPLNSGNFFFIIADHSPENCLTFRDKDIYCYLHFKANETAGILSLMNNYVIETNKIFLEGESTIFPVTGNIKINDRNYKRAVQLNRQENTIIISKMQTGIKDLYLTECHDQIDFFETTILRFSYYLKDVHTNNIRTDDYYGLKIENKNLNSNLINYLSSNQNEMIIIYIKESPKISLAISRVITSGIVYSYKGSAVNDYLRYDICSNPVYMQSLFIKSFINYNDKDKEYMKNNPGKNYYKYERDIGVAISCNDENSDNNIQPLKIEMPQCLNELDEINGNNIHKLDFSGNNDEIIFDIYNNPNLLSFRDVSINFNSSVLFVILITMEIKQDGDTEYSKIQYGKEYSKITHIKFKKNLGLSVNNPFTLPYKVINKASSENIAFNQMRSNICYLEISAFGDINGNQVCEINYCSICESETACRICNPEMGHMIVDTTESSETYGQCICDESFGMQRSPEKYNMCICKENYSFYNGINVCLKTDVLENMPTYIDEVEEKSQINIYRDCPTGCKSCNKDDQGVPKCTECIEGFFLKGNECSTKIDKCFTDEWFKIDKYAFNYVLLGGCVFIFQENDLFLISSREDCTPFMLPEYYEYMTDCLGNKNLDKNKFLDTENVASFVPSSEGIIAEKYFEDGKYHVHVIRFDNSQQKDDSVSSLELMNYNLTKDLLMVKVDIKREDTISTQVEYQFYDSTPSLIYQKVNLVNLKAIKKIYDFVIKKIKLILFFLYKLIYTYFLCFYYLVKLIFLVL